MENSNNTRQRWLILVVGVVTMLFAGIIYAWSILKAPLASEYAWDATLLTLNYTLTMSFFCIGGLLGSKLNARIGPKWTVMLAGVLSGSGMILTGVLNSASIIRLFLTYAFMAGLGIGIAYNVVISTVSAWFPDKKGLCSGCLMMGFGASTLLLGNLANSLFQIDSFGWKKTYVLIGILLGAVLVMSGLFIKRPSADTTFPKADKKNRMNKESFEVCDYKPSEMMKRFTFWRAFFALVFLTAVGSSVIGSAKDLAIEVGAEASLATTLVGVLAVCNGLGRIITGAVFDAKGRRFTMIGASVLTMFAAGVTLIAVFSSSLPLCIAGLCLTGLSYGSSPTVSSAFTSAFYGTKYFATNFSITNFNLIGASFIATLFTSLSNASGSYVVPFVVLLILSAVSLFLNLSIRRP